MINQFRGKYNFLSNMYECTINYKGFTFKSVESAFQAFKDSNRTKEFESLDPVSAKRLGRKVHLRSDWQEIKLNLMYELLQEKFKDPILKQKLLSTGNEELIEGNYWKDLYWGVDLQTNKGKNHLGKLLMKIRENFKI